MHIKKFKNVGTAMHLTPSDPDIATLYRKITQSRLDLQPNFQRGEVWGKQKKQRLIDSILRKWHIPPIHVIQIPNSEKQEVLDGQQRLAAIRDFIHNEFPINGYQDPVDSEIVALDGLSWEHLPADLRGRIEDYTIRLITISDYQPGEPGELFYRLNQPTNLTSAEQRNAYFGEARQQVKELSEFMTSLGFRTDTLGFSNSRMAYDDVIAKYLLTLEIKTLRKKITANSVTIRYRASKGFDNMYLNDAKEVLSDLLLCIQHSSIPLKLNKASVLSWMFFIHVHKSMKFNKDNLLDYFSYFQSMKKQSLVSQSSIDLHGITREFLVKIFEVFQDRSSSRVADTSSVVLRDFSLWIIYVMYHPEEIYGVDQLHQLYKIASYLGSSERINFIESSIEEKLEDVVSQMKWGAQL